MIYKILSWETFAIKILFVYCTSFIYSFSSILNHYINNIYNL